MFTWEIMSSLFKNPNPNPNPNPTGPFHCTKFKKILTADPEL